MKHNKLLQKSNMRLNLIAGFGRSEQIDFERPVRKLHFQLRLTNTPGNTNTKQFAGESARHPTPVGHCPHILLVDDDACLRALTARVLTWSGYTVQTAANGADAWKALESQNYDLLITENVMPWVTGVQLLKHLRSRGITMPVIMTSGTSPAKELKLHPGLRLEAALRKPVTNDKLLQMVNHVLQAEKRLASGCQTVQRKAPAGVPQPTGMNLPKRILFVDDEPLIRELHKEVLSDFGYAVKLAENGAAAWDALQVDRYDLLITDHEMPKLTGVELLGKLHAARMALPVIMVSGSMPTEELKRHQLPPVKATLSKPYTIADLLNIVKNILSPSESSREQLAPQMRQQI